MVRSAFIYMLRYEWEVARGIIVQPLICVNSHDHSVHFTPRAILHLVRAWACELRWGTGLALALRTWECGLNVGDVRVFAPVIFREDLVIGSYGSWRLGVTMVICVAVACVCLRLLR